MVCSICRRHIPISEYTEKHHLVPKSKKGKETILVCIDCADQIHNLFDIKELAREYNSLEKLLSHSSIQKWVSWVRKKKRFGICMRRKKPRRR